MKTTSPISDLSRRQFIGACCAGVGLTGMLSALAQLRVIGALTDPSNNPAPLGDGHNSGADYKALVCLFLAGGNDANNLLVPYDATSYAAYASARGSLALSRESLLPLKPRNAAGRELALHASLPELRDLFDHGNLALLANVGTLVVPTTKDQFKAKSVPLPGQLFSHNDQQVQWQSSVPDKMFSTGWGGRLADLTNALNENSRISMSVSLAGQNAFQVGRDVTQFAVNANGAVQPSGLGGGVGAIRARAEKNLMHPGDENLLAGAFAGLTTDAVTDSALLASVLGKSAPFTTEFPKSSLGAQLKMIGRMIAAAPALGLKRQIFFARIGGWDLHDGEITAHAKLLGDVSQSVAAFYKTTTELGLADQITTFTASDFGRTFTSNGNGSDHGWGSHHFILGGAVKGGELYGQMPDLVVNGADDTGRGRWIPTTSVDEYSATIARWFGVSATDLPTVFPNIGRFAKPDLGFMG